MSIMSFLSELGQKCTSGQGFEIKKSKIALKLLRIEALLRILRTTAKSLEIFHFLCGILEKIRILLYLAYNWCNDANPSLDRGRGFNCNRKMSNFNGNFSIQNPMKL